MHAVLVQISRFLLFLTSLLVCILFCTMYIEMTDGVTDYLLAALDEAVGCLAQES